MMFKEKTALITGAGSGIGKATAITFAEKGASVVIVDIDANTLECTKKEVEKIGVNVISYICDISDEEKVNEVANDALKKMGKQWFFFISLFQKNGRKVDQAPYN